MHKLSIPAILLGAATLCHAASDKFLAQHPTLSKTQIVFSYAGDLWSVPRDGGDAIRLTTGAGNETDPVFSPDGEMVAFTGEYDGNVDAFVVPASGGVPKRLTYHPGPDSVIGWTPDGKNVLFRSTRNSYSRFTRLFTIPVEGGFETEVDLPMADSGSFSADAKRIAYLPINTAFATWKRYRGGQTSPIWVANLADAQIEKIPRDNSNDFNPMWIGDKIYFLSDRSGPITLFSYDLKTKKVDRLVKNEGLDIKSASAGPGAIVYEQFGGIYLFDLKAGATKKVEIRLAGDIPGMRSTYEKVNGRFVHANLRGHRMASASPTSRTNRASMRCTYGRSRVRDRWRNSISVNPPRSSIRRGGRRTTRKSPIPTIACSFGTSISTRRRRCASMPIPTIRRSIT
jgi:tricorn protease